MEGRSALSRWVWGIAAGMALLHLGVNAWGAYGVFRDELYYLACAAHPAWGYVDQPPFSIALLATVRAMIGDSVFAIRLLPALGSAGLVAIVALLTRELGGRRFAQVSAALIASLGPVYLALFDTYSMNWIDMLVWVGAALLMARIANGEGRQDWITLGVLLGIGLLNKLSVLWLGAGLFAGLVLTRHRRKLQKPWPWIAAGIAVTISVPYGIWQMAHGWPLLEFMANARAGKMVAFGPLAFMGEALLEVNPLFGLVGLGGVVALFARRDLRSHRWGGWLFVTVAALLILAGSSKPYYLAGAFFAPFAAGTVWIERMTGRLGRSTAWRAGVLAILIVAGVLIAPFGLPILPPDTMVAWMDTLGVQLSASERHQQAALPQNYADRFGWRNLAEDVAWMYYTLPEDARRECLIFTTNYGRAGAIDYYSDEYGLPGAVSGHNNYHYWEPPGHRSGDVVLVIGSDPEALGSVFGSVEWVGASRCDRCMPYEANKPIYLCRNLLIPMDELWELARHFD